MQFANLNLHFLAPFFAFSLRTFAAAFDAFLALSRMMHCERTPRFRRLKLRVALAGLETQDG
jgi:hypothetical protein